MRELISSIVKIGLPMSVVASMFAQGLTITSSQLALFRERPLLMLRSLIVVLVLVPLATYAVILLFKPSQNVAVGLAILAACPAAPMMMVNVPKKGGSLAYIACLHLSLGVLALLTVPITLNLLSMALDFPVKVGVLAVARVVGMTILLPVSIGMLTRSFFPETAGKLGPVLAKLGGAALLVMVLLVMAMTSDLLLKMGLWSYVVMAIVVTVSIAIGHGLGPRDPEQQTTLAIESASRHPGLAMTIATLNFDPNKALPVLIPYLLVFMIVAAIYLQWRKRAANSETDSDQTANP